MRAPVALGIVLLLSGSPVVAQPPSAAQTRHEFERTCTALREGNNVYFGEAAIRNFEGRLGKAGLTPEERALLLGQLGFELIRIGRLEQAVERLQEADELAETNAVGRLVRLRILDVLAIAHLQWAEDLNCIDHHAATSCILPIAPEAVHRQPEQARLAARTLLRLLELEPQNVKAGWLLNLAAMVTGDYPAKVPERWRLPPHVLAPEAALPRWRDIAPDLGVAAFDLAGGAIMDDFDGDGLLDLVSSTSDPCGPMKAFRNDGNGGFTNVTSDWGLDGQLGGLNLVHADYDNDGLPDILVLRGGWWGEEGRMRNSLLRNDLAREPGRFQDVTASAGLAEPAYPTQTAAWADYDGDGDLDLYVGNESPADGTNPTELFGSTGRTYPSQLFRNQGDGSFVDVALAAGVRNGRYAKGVAWGDYDDDGDPDLYVSNIGPNRLYRNNGDATFTDVAAEAGVLEPAEESFATWFFDFDNDGDLDLFVADYGASISSVAASYFGADVRSGHPLLYRNTDGVFEEVSRQLGITRPALPMGANYGDLDTDGFPDIYLGTGLPHYDALMPNQMYAGRGGESFREVTFAGGFGHLQKGHGVAFGDLDNDGHQDLFQQLGGAYPYDGYGNALYLNPGADAHWIVLELVGVTANRSGIGARIAIEFVTADGPRTVHALAGSGGSFGASSLRQEIGLGGASAIEKVVVTWPGSGTRQVFEDVAPDRFYRVREDSPVLVPLIRPHIDFSPGVRSGH